MSKTFEAHECEVSNDGREWVSAVGNVGRYMRVKPEIWLAWQRDLAGLGATKGVAIEGWSIVVSQSDDLGVAIIQRSEGSDILFVSRAEAEQLAKQKAANSVAFVSYLEVLREIADGAVPLYGKPLRIRD